MSDSKLLKTWLLGLAVGHLGGNDISNEELEELYNQAKEEIRNDPDGCKKEVAEWRERVRDEDPFLNWILNVYSAL